MTSSNGPRDGGDNSSSDSGSDATPPRRRRRRKRGPRREGGQARPEPTSSVEKKADGGRRERPRPKPKPVESVERTEAPPRKERQKRPSTPPASASGFRPFDLEDGVLRGLASAGYEEPTEIQERMIPIALEGHNVVARSRTGTGKTCAFLVPAFMRLDEVIDGEPGHGGGPVRVLVVEPTRELAMQVANESEKLSRFLPVRTACVYGGTPLKRQFQEIPRSAIVVGTPGRLLDHIGRGTMDARTIEMLVLDEVDRMYDLGFRDDVDRIVAACPRREQIILVSATLNEDVESLVAKHVGAHERILIESRSLTVDEVDQAFYVVANDRKRELLMALIRERKPTRSLIFTRTRFTADRVAYVLQNEGFDAHVIHGGLPQQRREWILRRFREGKLELLVATDVAARGLDIENIDHVINYDIPQSPEDYVHRVGRTARMGKEGWAVTLVGPDDGGYLTDIEKLINKQITQERFPGFGMVPDPEPGAEPAADGPEVAKDEVKRPTGLQGWVKPVRRRRR